MGDIFLFSVSFKFNFCKMKALTFSIVAALISLVHSQVSFNSWQIMYNITYSTPADASNTRQAFDMNNAFITLINSRSRQSYFLGLNEFSDLTFGQFQSRHLGLVVPKNANRISITSQTDITMNIIQPVQRSLITVPDSIDYTNYTLAVKHQLNCGSCYAFAVLDTLGTLK